MYNNMEYILRLHMHKSHWSYDVNSFKNFDKLFIDWNLHFTVKVN